MSESSYKFNFGILKMSIFISIILAVLKETHVLDINVWMVLFPVFIAIGMIFFAVFLIGCITIFYLAKGLNDGSIELPEDEKEVGSDE